MALTMISFQGVVISFRSFLILSSKGKRITVWKDLTSLQVITSLQVVNFLKKMEDIISFKEGTISFEVTM